MNPIAIIHVFSSLVAIALSVPLIQGRVKMNDWYGVRVPEALASDERWFDINRYGGRLLFCWGVLLAFTAAWGLLISEEWWRIYNYASLAPIFGGILMVVVLVSRYAKRPPNQSPEPTR